MSYDTTRRNLLRIGAAGIAGAGIASATTAAATDSSTAEPESSSTVQLDLPETVKIPQTQWNSTWLGGSETENAWFNAVEPLPDGGYIAGGGLADFRTQQNSPLLVKLSADGQKGWSSYYEFSRADFVNDLTVLPDGSIVAVGETHHEEDYSGYHPHPIAIHVNASGEVQHRKEWESLNARFLGSTQTGDGNIAVSGMIAVEEGYSTRNIGRVVKLTPSLSQEWELRTGDGSFNRLEGIDRGPDGQIVAAGTHTEDDNDNGWLVKLNGDGEQIWESTFGGGNSDWFNDVVVAGDSKITAVGNTQSFGSGHKNAWAVQTDASGNGLWNNNYRTSDEVAHAVRSVSSGGFVLVSRGGDLEESYTTDPQVRTAVARKIDSSGNELWVQEFDGDGYEFNDVAVTGQDLLLAGDQAGNAAWGVGVREVENELPSPSISVPTDNPGLGTVTFDATASSDDGEISTFAWDFNQDGSFERTGETVEYQFSSEGEHTVTLRTTDDMGSTATTTVTVTVENKQPQPSFELSPDPPHADETVELDASGSTDPDGSVSEYAWDIGGDGTFEHTGQQVEVEFDDAEQTEVVLRVTDSHGATKTTSRTITVLEEGATATESTGGDSGSGAGGDSGSVSQPGFGVISALGATLAGAGLLGYKKYRN